MSDYKFRYYKGVRYVAPNNPAPDSFARCGHCNRAWDDDKSTSLTPAPSGRCPFEYMHTYPTDASRRRLVSAPLGASAYKNGNTQSALAHAVELDEVNGDVIKVLCGRAKPASILPDSSQFNRHHVDCPRCLAILTRKGITLPTRE